MAFNRKKAFALLQKDLKKNWGKLDFEYKQESSSSVASNSCTLNGFDDDIYVSFRVTDSAALYATATFDKLEPSYDALMLINEFNRGSVYFKAHIGSKGYLAFEYVRLYNTEKDFADCASDMLRRLIDLQEDEQVKQLASMTE